MRIIYCQNFQRVVECFDILNQQVLDHFADILTHLWYPAGPFISNPPDNVAFQLYNFQRHPNFAGPLFPTLQFITMFIEHLEDAAEYARKHPLGRDIFAPAEAQVAAQLPLLHDPEEQEEQLLPNDHLLPREPQEFHQIEPNEQQDDEQERQGCKQYKQHAFGELLDAP